MTYNEHATEIENWDKENKAMRRYENAVRTIVDIRLIGSRKKMDKYLDERARAFQLLEEAIGEWAAGMVNLGLQYTIFMEQDYKDHATSGAAHLLDPVRKVVDPLWN